MVIEFFVSNPKILSDKKRQNIKSLNSDTKIVNNYSF